MKKIDRKAYRVLAIAAAALLVVALVTFMRSHKDHAGSSGADAPASASNTPSAGAASAASVPADVPASAGAEGSPPPVAPGQPRGGMPSQVSGTNADLVARAWVSTVWTVDSRIDSSATDGARRALRWAAPQFAKKPLTLPSDGLLPWADMTAADAYSTTSTRDIDSDAQDTATAAMRVMQITVTDRNASGAELIRATYYLTVGLTRSAQHGWLVSSALAQ